jgi:hypothetical protein
MVRMWAMRSFHVEGLEAVRQSCRSEGARSVSGECQVLRAVQQPFQRAKSVVTRPWLKP